MTNPMLAEMDEVVLACDKASAMLPSPEGNTAIKEAETAATNWVIAHHATLADMAKRLDAAERDAAKWKGVESVMAMAADKIEGQITSSCGLLLIDYAARNSAGKVELRFGGVTDEETGELGDWTVRIEKAIDAAQEGEG